MQSVFGLRAHGESHVIPALAQADFHLRSYYQRFKDDPGDLLIRQLPMDRIEQPLFESIRAFYREIYEGDGWADKTPSDEAVSYTHLDVYKRQRLGRRQRLTSSRQR